jgi:hypothetical protein
MKRVSGMVDKTNGPEGWWKEMVQQTRANGFFTAPSIYPAPPRKRSALRVYLSACISLGVIERLGDVPGRLLKTTLVAYRVLPQALRLVDAPIRRRSGYTGMAGRRGAAIWTAMRYAGPFTSKSLASLASTDDLVINQRYVEKWIERLNHVGLLIVLTPRQHVNGRLRSAVYRLRPDMNTGPKPPAFLTDGSVFDRNLKVRINVTTHAGVAA